jgi:hypothetical protein
LIVYDFESETAGALADAASIANAGTSGANGTVGGTAGGTATIVTGAGPGGLTTNYLSLAPSNEDFEGGAAPHIGTGGTINSLQLGGDKAYTFAAWVRYGSQANDNMVFGSNAGDVLHLGSRGNQHWSGHWGDDINSGATQTEVGVWHHVAWTNTAGDGLQTIYVDGAPVATGGGIDGNGNPQFGAYGGNGVEALLVGTSRNKGSFKGDLDDVRVYNETLSGAEVAALAAVAIPEPTSGILLSLASLALLRRRR